MTELELKYGCNPNQKPSRVFMRGGSDLPVTVLNGKPGYINFLDALNSWQLARELKEATGGIPSAASFLASSPCLISLAEGNDSKLPLWINFSIFFFLSNVHIFYSIKPFSSR